MQVKPAQGQPKELKDSDLKFQLGGGPFIFPLKILTPSGFRHQPSPKLAHGPTLPSAGSIMHDDRGNQQPMQPMAFRQACPGTPSTPPQISFQPT